jgi:hypothetical protein
VPLDQRRWLIVLVAAIFGGASGFLLLWWLGKWQRKTVTTRKPEAASREA